MRADRVLRSRRSPRSVPDDTKQPRRHAAGRAAGEPRMNEAPTRDRVLAEEWEEDMLASYRSNHGGRNPRYNETDK